MANVTFSGSVSAQAQSGETVTVTVTKPDNTTESLTAQTQVDNRYSVTTTYPAGNYSAVASGLADAVYTAWQSQSVVFTVTLQTRSGTLTVSLS